MALTFFCTTSCQLMLRKNLCSMTSLASLGPPPSLGRDSHEHPPPRAARFWETLSVQAWAYDMQALNNLNKPVPATDLHLTGEESEHSGNSCLGPEPGDCNLGQDQNVN